MSTSLSTGADKLPDQARPQDAGARVLLDDPQEWSAFGRPCGLARGEQTAPPAEAARWESYVVLGGMHCAACALTIEDALRTVPGVEQAEVSAATQRARIVWDARRVLPSQWLAAVQKAGYTALPALDAFTRERRLQESRRALWRWAVAGFA